MIWFVYETKYWRDWRHVISNDVDTSFPCSLSSCLTRVDCWLRLEMAPQSFQQVVFAIQAVAFILGSGFTWILGWTVLRQKRLWTLVNALVVYEMAVNCIVTAVTLVVSIPATEVTTRICIMGDLCTIVGFYESFLTFCTVVFLRYLAVCFRRPLSLSRHTFVCSVLPSLLLTALPMSFYSTYPVTRNCYLRVADSCDNDTADSRLSLADQNRFPAFLVLSVSIIGGPFLFTCYALIHVTTVVRKSRRRVVQHLALRQRFDSVDIITAMSCFGHILLVGATYLPPLVNGFIVHKTKSDSPRADHLPMFVSISTLASSTVDPVLYLVTSRDFRSAVSETICRWGRRDDEITNVHLPR